MPQTINHMQGKELFCEKRSLISLVSFSNPVADRDVTAIMTMRKMPGCPIHYYVIEYKEESQPTWRIVSNNIRSEEESIIIRLTMVMVMVMMIVTAMMVTTMMVTPTMMIVSKQYQIRRRESSF